MKTQQEVLRKFALAGIVICSAVSPIQLEAASSEREGGPADRGGISSSGDSGASYEILAQHRINLGERSIFYNLVSAPIFSERSRNPIPPPLSSSEQEQASSMGVQKDYLVAWLFADIYNHKISEVRWGDESQYRAFSNIDFNLINGETVETSKAFYSLFVLPSNSHVADEVLNGFSSLGLFDLIRGEYILDNTGATPPAEELELMNSVHAYYDAHKPELLVKYQEQEEERSAREAWLKANPPVPKDTIINFWPIKNSAYLDAETKGDER